MAPRLHLKTSKALLHRMNEPPPADVLGSELNRQLLDLLMTGLFLADVFFFVVMLLLVFACCWETIRERRQNALALENLRREAITLAGRKTLTFARRT